MNDFKNLHDLLSRLPDELSCRQYFEQYRWEDGKPICPYCGGGKAYRIERGKRFKCGNSECYKKYSVLVGTIFEASNIPLQKWFIALYMATSHKKGISSCQLARDLGVTLKTSWFMLHRIRFLMESGLSKKPFEDIVQADEAFMGGKNRNRHAHKRTDLSQGRAYKDKTPVLGVMQFGQVVAKVIPNTQAETIRQTLKTIVKKDAILVSDNYDAYGWMRGYCLHVIINHAAGQYASGAFDTNSIEGFWSHLKRMVYGIYHQISPKHLQRYCDEMSFRFNSRKTTDASRFRISLTYSEGRLKYRDLTNKLLSSSYGQEADKIPEK